MSYGKMSYLRSHVREQLAIHGSRSDGISEIREESESAAYFVLKKSAIVIVQRSSRTLTVDLTAHLIHLSGVE